MSPAIRRAAGARTRCAWRPAAVAAFALVASGMLPGALAQSCLQRAFALLAPCETSLVALTGAVSLDGRLDVDGALATLGGSRSALPAAVTQCCAALAPFNDARCERVRVLMT